MEWICKISNDSILLQYQCACCMCIEFSCRKSLSTVSSVQLRASEWNCRLLFSSILSFVRFGLSVKDSFVVFGMYCMLHRWQFVDLCYVTELTSLAENFFAHIQRLPCSSSIHTNSIVTDEQRIRQGRRKGRRIEKSKFELRFLPHSHSHISCCNNSKMWYTAMNSPTIDPCASFNTWDELQYSTIHQMNSMQKLKTPQRSHLTLKVRQHTKSCTSFLRLPNSSYRPPSFTRAIFGWFDGLVSYCYCCCCHYIRAVVHFDWRQLFCITESFYFVNWMKLYSIACIAILLCFGCCWLVSLPVRPWQCVCMCVSKLCAAHQQHHESRAWEFSVDGWVCNVQSLLHHACTNTSMKYVRWLGREYWPHWIALLRQCAIIDDFSLKLKSMFSCWLFTIFGRSCVDWMDIAISVSTL